MTTAEKLKSLNNGALFETIANAVLRYKFPILENIIVTGLNEKGETIKDPMDAFSEIVRDHFAMIHHTINDSDLKRKWLNKGTSKSGQGDLVKAIESAIRIRSLRPDSSFTVYLSTNQRIPSDLQIEVSGANPYNFIRIEFVDVSVLADFLDHTSQGQYLRKQYLQIDAELLSQNLLEDITRKNLAQYKAGLFPVNAVVIKTRGIEVIEENILNSPNQLKLLVSDSGFGKSTAAYYLMEKFISEKKNALRITPRVIDRSNSFTEAILNQLVLEHPKLYKQPEVIPLLFNSKSLIVIDDINQHEKPLVLLDKIISWTLLPGEPLSGMTILCPMWQKNYRLLEGDLTKKRLYDTLTLAKLAKKDSYELVKNSTDGKVALTISQIHTIINDVQTDPLLLKLYCSEIIDKGFYIPNHGQHIIYSFIDRKLRSQAAEQPFGELQLAAAIEKLGIAMLQNRTLNPRYDDLQKWFGSEPVVLSVIEAISKQRELFYFDNDLLLFRHDRIRDAILVLSCQKVFNASVENENILKDPYYAEIIGTALSRSDLPQEKLEWLIAINPPAVFYSLKFLQNKEEESKFEQILGCIRSWNAQIKERVVPEALTRNIAFNLITFDTKEIKAITEGFPESIELSLARFRNGIGEEGVKFFAYSDNFPPTFNNYWRDVVLDHVIAVHFQKTVGAIKHLLSLDLTDRGRRNVYLLAGYLKAPELLPQLSEYWRQHQQIEDLTYYLWTVLNCFGAEREHLVVEGLEYWKQLPEDNDNNSNTKGGFKTHVYLEFYRTLWELSENQISFLSSQSENPEFEKLIFGIFYGIDSPESLKVVIKQLARQREQNPNDWRGIFEAQDDRWDYDKHHYRLTIPSRNFLLKHWEDKGNHPYERKLAFRYWLGNEEVAIVLERLQKIGSDDDILFEDAIFQRAKLKDESVTGNLISLIRKDLWKVRYAHFIWNQTLKDFIKQILPDAIVKRDGGFIEEVLSVLMKINDRDAEDILCTFWSEIRTLHHAIGTALYIATEKTRALAREEIDHLGFKNWERIRIYYQGPLRGHYTIPDQPEDLSDVEKHNIHFLAEEFKYLYFNYGEESTERLTIHRLNSLVPYFQLMDDMSLSEFARKCKRLGYFDWLYKMLFPHLSEHSQKDIKPTEDDIVSELHDMATDKYHYNLEEYIRNLPSRGIDQDKFIHCLEKYSGLFQSLKDCFIVCRCFEIVGSRKAIPIIEGIQLINEAEYHKAQKIKSNTIFKIQRTSLQ